VGAILIGYASIASALKKLIENGTSCTELLSKAGNARDVYYGIATMSHSVT
jgi:ActR/RegA family two-component response regulator